jgi:PadR family transcriptional regulator, regulatory protein AphA
MNQTVYASALSPEYALLGLLAQKPAHGYELHQRLEAKLGQVWHVSLSQTYNILKRLEGQGFILGAVEKREKLPRRCRYSLTPSGQKRFETWLRQPTGASVRAIRVEFITRLYFARLVEPDLASRLLENQAAETRAGLERLQSLYEDLGEEDNYNRLSLALRIRQLEAVLYWLDEVALAPGIFEDDPYLE